MNPLSNGYSAVVDTFDMETWHSHVAGFSDGNLYQLWQHQSVSERLTGVSRILLEKRGEVVGAAEVRLFTLPLISRGIAYLRWGPLWKRGAGSKDPEHFRQALRALRNEYVGRRGMILRVVPRLFQEDDPQCVDILTEEGFSALGRGRPHKTLLMDLSPPLEELRKGLGSTWRRHLNKAEKSGLILTAGAGVEPFDEFVPLYNALLDRKGFAPTTSIQRHRSIQAALPVSLGMGVVLARRDGQPCAGAVYSAIGDTALFVFGAVNELGMRCSASYLVHWEVLRLLMQQGIREYDLNGISPELNPGTFQFKNGLAGRNGRQVTFVGQSQAFERSIVNRSFLFADSLRDRVRMWRAGQARGPVERAPQGGTAVPAP